MKTGILTFKNTDSKAVFLNRCIHQMSLEGLKIFLRQCDPLSVVYAARDVDQGFAAISLASCYQADYKTLESEMDKFS